MYEEVRWRGERTVRGWGQVAGGRKGRHNNRTTRPRHRRRARSRDQPAPASQLQPATASYSQHQPASHGQQQQPQRAAHGASHRDGGVVDTDDVEKGKGGERKKKGEMQSTNCNTHKIYGMISSGDWMSVFMYLRYEFGEIGMALRCNHPRIQIPIFEIPFSVVKYKPS